MSHLSRLVDRISSTSFKLASRIQRPPHMITRLFAAHTPAQTLPHDEIKTLTIDKSLTKIEKDTVASDIDVVRKSIKAIEDLLSSSSRTDIGQTSGFDADLIINKYRIMVTDGSGKLDKAYLMREESDLMRKESDLMRKESDLMHKKAT